MPKSGSKCALTTPVYLYYLEFTSGPEIVAWSVPKIGLKLNYMRPHLLEFATIYRSKNVTT
jgi:hypothetical protein